MFRYNLFKNGNLFCLRAIIFLSFMFSFSAGFAAESANGSDQKKSRTVKYFSKSKNKISGYLPNSRTFFSVRNPDGKDRYTFSLRFKKKNIKLEMGNSGEERELHFYQNNLETGEAESITEDVSTDLQNILISLVDIKELRDSKLGDKLIRVVNFLSAMPGEVMVDYSNLTLTPENWTAPKACEAQRMDGWKTICRKVGEKHPASWYPGNGKNCGSILYKGKQGKLRGVGMQLQKPTQKKVTRNTLVGGSGCVGRCGKGCNGDGPPNRAGPDKKWRWFNIYTQACLDHDVCIGEHNNNASHPVCNWMFLAAFDDFMNAPDCDQVKVEPSIRVNNKKSVTIKPKDKVSIQIGLKVPDYFGKQKSDHWIYVKTPSGKIYSYYKGYVSDGWAKGLHEYSGTRKDYLTGMVPKNGFSLKIAVDDYIMSETGKYEFVFSIDDNNNKKKDKKEWKATAIVNKAKKKGGGGKKKKGWTWYCVNLGFAVCDCYPVMSCYYDRTNEGGNDSSERYYIVKQWTPDEKKFPYTMATEGSQPKVWLKLKKYCGCN